MNTVKKTIIIALFLLFAFASASEVQAQRRKVMYLQNYDNAPYHWGFLLGANFMDYNITLKNNYQEAIYTDFRDLPTEYTLTESSFLSYQIIEVERDTMSWPFHNIPRAGFSIGIIGDLRLTDKLNLRFIPTFSMSEINYLYNLKINKQDGTYELYDGHKTGQDNMERPWSHNEHLNCVEFPLHLKYRSKRYNNIAGYLFTGANPKLYFSRKKKNQVTKWLETKAFDVAYEVGSGFDFYNPWFRMGVEFKFAFGLFDAMSAEQVNYFAHPIKGLKNKQFQISVTFE